MSVYNILKQHAVEAGARHIHSAAVFPNRESAMDCYARLLNLEDSETTIMVWVMTGGRVMIALRSVKRAR